MPFRDESSLLRENETAEQAFNRLLPQNDDCSAHQEQLKKMLQAKANVKSINEARKAQAVDAKENEQDGAMQVPGQEKSAWKT